jgi:(2Fe-2S) ferredoxin
MSKYQQHYFVCTNTRPPFAKPSCGAHDSAQFVMALKEAVEQNGLQDNVKVTACGCLGPCENGPMIVVYPDGVWYKNVHLNDIADIVKSHMMTNIPVKRLIYNWSDENGENI